MGTVTVRATFPNGGFGFDGQGRRRDGDLFQFDEDKIDPSWMEVVSTEEVDGSEEVDQAPKKKGPARKTSK